MSKSLLILDDDPFLADGLRKLLQAEGYDVRTAGLAAEGLRLIQDKQPDLLVLDLNLPDDDGVTVCRKIRAAYRFPVLMLTSRSSQVDKVVGLEVGADDFLTKPFESAEFLARVRAQLRRSSEYTVPVEPKAINVGPLRIDEEARLATLEQTALELTETEYKVLTLLATNKGRALSRDRLFDAAWGYEIDFNSNSLEVIIYRLRNKIRAAGGPELVHTVRGFGYKLEV